MGIFLQILFNWHFYLCVLVIAIVIYLAKFIIKKIKQHPNILLGVNGLVQSPSGVFGLLTLAAITVVTLKQPTVGGIAFAAFVGVVPAILAICEHRETLVGISPIAPVVPQTPTNTTIGATITIPPANLPPRGQL